MQKKGLTLFEWLVKTLIGNPEDYSLEHRFFIAACFVGGMSGILASIINLSISLHPALIFTTASIAILYFLFYYISLKQKKYKGLILPYIFISLLALSYLWFINSGSNGPISNILFTALLVYIVLTRGANRITAIAGFAITLTVLHVWEYLHPEVIVNYPDAKSKFIDVFFTALFNVGLVAFIASFIMKNYHDEREKVIRQWNTILEQNKEIKLAEKKLLRYQENLEELVRQRTRELEESNIQLLKAKEKAEESDRLKSAFLSNMSHEIRTPMNAIVGFSYLMKDPELNPETRNQYIDIITGKGNLLMHIINDIIDISKVEAGEMEIKMGACNVNQLMDELFITFSKLLESVQKTGIDLRIEKAEKDEEITISTDTYRIKQVLTNLIDNAIKFTHEGHVEAGYSIIMEGNEKRLRFYVKDSGIGISSQNSELIFTRFRQIDESHTREYGGTGLGLSISKKLVELLGGNLEVESSLGKGSSFYFSIPYLPLKILNIQQSEPPEETRDYNWQNKTVLVVEDNVTGYILLENYLKPTGVNLIQSINGQDAVDICKNNPGIDMVLMDIQLPVLNGYDATILIKKQRKNLPVIAVTAHALSEDILSAKVAGFDDYLTKPLVKESLLKTMSKYFLH